MKQKKGLCENYNLCNIIHPVEQLNRILTDFLKELTLEELLLGTNPFAPTLLVEAAKKEVEA